MSSQPADLVRYLYRSKNESTRKAGDEFLSALNQTKMHKYLFMLNMAVGTICSFFINSLIIHLISRRSGQRYIFTFAVTAY